MIRIWKGLITKPKISVKINRRIQIAIKSLVLSGEGSFQINHLNKQRLKLVSDRLYNDLEGSEWGTRWEEWHCGRMTLFMATSAIQWESLAESAAFISQLIQTVKHSCFTTVSQHNSPISSQTNYFIQQHVQGILIFDNSFQLSLVGFEIYFKFQSFVEFNHGLDYSIGQFTIKYCHKFIAQLSINGLLTDDSLTQMCSLFLKKWFDCIKLITLVGFS